MRNIFYEITDKNMPKLGIFPFFGVILLGGVAAGILYFEARPFYEVFVQESSVSLYPSSFLNSGFFVFVAWIPIWVILKYFLGYRKVTRPKRAYWIAFALMPVFIGLISYGILVILLHLNDYIHCHDSERYPRNAIEKIYKKQIWYRRESCDFDQSNKADLN